jgi:two-component system cell cycle sensor histidine kinase/response regulator CckA
MRAEETRIQEVEPAWDPTSPEIQSAYLEQLVECTPEAITILDTAHRVVRVNREFQRLFGFLPAEALGQRLDTLLVPAACEAENQWIIESVEQGERVQLETRRRRKDGTLVEVAISCAPVMVGEKLLGVYVAYRDIREQKVAQALSSALYRIAERTNTLENLPEFFRAVHAIVEELMYARNFYIALYDEAGQTLSFPYFVDEEEEAAPSPKRPGKGLTEYVLQNGEPLLATPEVFDDLVKRSEVELIGAPSVDWLGVPLRAGNQTFGVLVVQSYSQHIRFGERDKEILTFVSQQLASAIDHKRNEEALRRSEARYRSLVQSAVYGIYRSSVDGKFLDVNPALIAMLGYETVGQVLGLDPTSDVFVNPAEQARLMQEFQQKGRLDSIEVHWKRKDGKTITVQLSGRAVTEAEADPALELIAEDVTERRALEEQFRQAQKMEAVGRLAGGVAHDFNNLLMVISGYTEVLLEQMKADHPVQAKVQAIQQAADRATTLTRQLLAFSRKQLLELKVVDVNSIVADMERLLRPLIGENVELSTRLTPGVGRTRADAGQLEQVLMNLVVNAKDALPKGGKIVIQTSEATLGEYDSREHGLIVPGSYVLLSVSDNGMGMDRETQSRIFEPFFTTKEKGKGTGLGLSTVYGIVKQSGGYIFAESTIGRGTTFRIYLPRVDDRAEHVSAKNAGLQAGGGSETILLVEDEESVRQLVRETLQTRGYHVIEAENGDAGLRVADEYAGDIDLVITDVVMPGMNGRELAKRLAGSRPSMRVLYLSGYTEEAIIHEGAMEPGTAFLQKPFTLQVLSRKVREVLRGERT